MIVALIVVDILFCYLLAKKIGANSRIQMPNKASTVAASNFLAGKLLMMINNKDKY